MNDTSPLILSPEGTSGQKYRSPNGKLWRISRVNDDVAHLWAYDTFGLIVRAECNPAQLFPVSSELA